MSKIINDQEQLVKQLLSEKLQEKTRLTSTNYPDRVAFDCGCGENHKVNDPSLSIIKVLLLRFSALKISLVKSL